MLDTLILLAPWVALSFVVGVCFAAYRLRGKGKTMQALMKVLGGGGSGVPQ